LVIALGKVLAGMCLIAIAAFDLQQVVNLGNILILIIGAFLAIDVGKALVDGRFKTR
jgi:hypothetical protein